MNSDPIIFDRKLKRKQRERASETISKAAYLYNEAASRLKERLEDINRTFPTTINLDWREFDFICDEEFLPLKKNSANLITSLLNLHWVNDVPGALIQIRQALAPDGLFLGSLFGGMTLHELRQVQIEAETELYGGVSPRISPFTDTREMAGLLQRAGFELPVADTESITVYYPDAFTLMQDLKMMGENNALIKRPKNFFSRRLLNSINERYQQRFGNSEGIPATFEIITITGWSPA